MYALHTSRARHTIVIAASVAAGGLGFRVQGSGTPMALAASKRTPCCSCSRHTGETCHCQPCSIHSSAMARPRPRDRAIANAPIEQVAICSTRSSAKANQPVGFAIAGESVEQQFMCARLNFNLFIGRVILFYLISSFIFLLFSSMFIYLSLYEREV